jgi:MFS transporter, DHA3 family, macrolide efflux protein
VPAETSERPLSLLHRRDFRRVYFAVAASELGDAFQYVALMWFALSTGGPLGVLAVRLADSLPALAFGFHGGLVADRLDRRRTMVTADLARASVLIPVAVLGLSGHLPLWLLVVAAFVITTADSYFAPAYGAILPSIVERRNVQSANGLLRATTEALSVGGWAIAAGLLAFTPISAFFGINAASFLVSALLLAGITAGRGRAAHESTPRIREGFAALRPRPVLAAAVLALGVGVTISSGTWIVGVPTLVRDTLHRGAGSFALTAMAYALGSMVAGVILTRRPVARKALGSLLAWTIYLPAYALFAFAGSLWVVLAGAALAGLAQGSAWILVNSAAQTEVPDHLLGRVTGLIALTHRGAHATGLLFVSPLFALVAPDTVFAAAALAIPLVGIAGALSARVVEARARGTDRTLPA